MVYQPRMARVADVLIPLALDTAYRMGGFARGGPTIRLEGHVWTPPPVQEESLDSCGAGSGAAMCPASAAAAHRPRARMGVRGSGPHHRSALEALSLRLVLLIPPHRRLRHTCPSTSSHHRQPHARRPLMRRRPELDNFRPWRSTPTRSAPSCWPALR